MSNDSQAIICDRCGKTRADGPFYSEIMDTITKRKIRLCPQCGKEFCRWFERRGVKIERIIN